MRLNELKDNAGARHPRRRVGRGLGSGKGRTSGRGHKGQKSRSGVAIKGFEGGQMPIHRRLPKRGFNNVFRKQYAVVNLGRLQVAIDARKVDARKTITIEVLTAAGVVGRVRDGVRLLAKGVLNTIVNIEVTGASAAAIAAVEKAGGSVKVTISAEETRAAAEAKKVKKADKRALKKRGKGASKDAKKDEKGSKEAKKDDKKPDVKAEKADKGSEKAEKAPETVEKADKGEKDAKKED
ncbi:MAG: 50S ribosomal protein L15 [Proteobacteria bacterium]|nr:50S ribosomal protein L15 [Pseudomonadota bacterium]